MSNEREERAEILGRMRRLAKRKYQLLSDTQLSLRHLRSKLPSGQEESDDQKMFRDIESIYDLAVEASKTFFLSIDFYFMEFNSIENRKRLDALSNLFIILSKKLDYQYRIIYWMLVVVDQNGPSQISLVRPIYRQFNVILMKVIESVQKLEVLLDSDDFESFLDNFNAQQK
ncbi:hypothetical protein QR98_0025430 [Sarcoptes scabiei]|uniref:Uncharacterized protein n=1 Tax=Sarcoptes scabiei TaxID=52283 RepID=A0A131ZZJ5_SARSC|nr:hypothetical protein QR98_0025430 [Sarcoptes scabiei]